MLFGGRWPIHHIARPPSRAAPRGGLRLMPRYGAGQASSTPCAGRRGALSLAPERRGPHGPENSRHAANSSTVCRPSARHILCRAKRVRVVAIGASAVVIGASAAQRGRCRYSGAGVADVMVRKAPPQWRKMRISASLARPERPTRQASQPNTRINARREKRAVVTIGDRMGTMCSRRLFR